MSIHGLEEEALTAEGCGRVWICLLELPGHTKNSGLRAMPRPLRKFPFQAFLSRRFLTGQS